MADQIFTVNGGFFNSINGDRKYNAEQMNRPYKRIVSNGVFATSSGTPSTDLQVVSAEDGMKINVTAGEGLFGDKWFENPSDLTITVPNNNDVLPRLDSLIVQIDNRESGRKPNIVYRDGTPASTPEAPDINTVTDVIEYRIANVYVAPSETEITDSEITDLRGSSSCPWVTGLIEQVDTSTLYTQWQAAYQAYYTQETEAFDAFMRTLTEQLSVTTNVITLESHYTSVEEVTEVPINITGFDQTKDVLIVFINGLRATVGINYTIALDNSKINLISSMTAGQSVNFLVLKSVVEADNTTALQLLQQINNTLTTIITDSGWSDFVLENGVLEYSSSLTPGLRKYNNQVFLRGAIKNVTTVDTIFATLPIGYRPAMIRYYTIATGSITITIEINTDGQLKIANIIGTVESTSLIPIDTNFIVD